MDMPETGHEASPAHEERVRKRWRKRRRVE